MYSLNKEHFDLTWPMMTGYVKYSRRHNIHYHQMRSTHSSFLTKWFCYMPLVLSVQDNGWIFVFFKAVWADCTTTHCVLLFCCSSYWYGHLSVCFLLHPQCIDFYVELPLLKLMCMGGFFLFSPSFLVPSLVCYSFTILLSLLLLSILHV